MTSFAGVWSAPAFIAGVYDDELDAIRGLYQVWQGKFPRNRLRSRYRDMKVRVKPSPNVPAEAMARVEAVSDWPEKAVTSLAERSVFDGFVAPGAAQDPFDLKGVLDDNRFDLELPAAIESAYTHSCSFVTTALGDVQAGEPEVVVMAREALWTAARWDSRRRVIRDLLCVTDVDESGNPTEMDVLFPHAVVTLRRRPSGAWAAERRENPLGEVLAEPLAYAPTLARPFGRSRISRAVMNLTDRALLAVVRNEIASDFYAVPRMYALGVAEDAFSRGKWAAAIDSWFAITRDEDGEVPQVGQFPQMTTQPLQEHYRLLASQFSGATGVPLNALGIVTDNPSSAEAMYADDRRLVHMATKQNKVFTASLRRVGQRIVQLRDGKGEVSDELRGLDVAWVNPAFTSPAASADALTKLASVFPWLAESEVALQFAGFSQAEITRLLSDKRRASGASVLERALARQEGQRVPGGSGEPAVTGDDEA